MDIQLPATSDNKEIGLLSVAVKHCHFSMLHNERILDVALVRDDCMGYESHLKRAIPGRAFKYSAIAVLKNTNLFEGRVGYSEKDRTGLAESALMMMRHVGH
jgi:hypothetical protein